LSKELVEGDQITASGPRSDRGDELTARYGVHSTIHNHKAVKGQDVVVLSVKPQLMPTVMDELRGTLKPDCYVVSIAAGLTISRIVDAIGHKAVVRVMPNTPSQIGEGMSVWTATEAVTESQLMATQSILSALGEDVHVDDERYLDMATAVSGTGPAYILLFMEAMIDAGVHLGFSRRVAEQLVMQTMKGTVAYVREAGKHPATLRNEVTSPGGTSAEALYHLEKGGLRTVMARAIWAAYQRSAALGGSDLGRRLAGQSPDGE
ncbi:MAG: pyrroline-5-carboxylate reductase, partial [Chloroflexi bacterium]|nr:pyrroline-5-carboxylate reductase [Chloroflexota bacterium]